MAFNFSANQFNNAYKASRLSNWEVSKCHPERPRIRKGVTKIISNDRGHLLPNVSRPQSNPWGKFKNTWQLPDKISRRQAEELSAELAGYKREPLDLEYIPGNITTAEEQHTSRELLLRKKYERDKGQAPRLESNELFLEKHKCDDTITILNEDERQAREKEPHVLGEEVEDNFEKMRLNAEIPDKPNQRAPSPLIPASFNFQMAKKMAQENLDHQPLPDCVMDKAFRKLQAQGVLDPGLALDVLPSASGVGIKTYKAGPTHCTKMKVFRPKTCGILPKPVDKLNLHRPQTSYPIKDKMGAMDLAICWDYRPLNPADEPKPPKHIDGSNGSSAPAVFTLVKTPRTPEKTDTGRLGGIFTNTLGNESFFDKDILRRKTGFMQRSKTDLKCSCGTSPASFRNLSAAVYRSPSATREEGVTNEKRKRCKSSPNLSEIVHPGDDSYKENRSHYNEDVAPRKKKEHTCSKYGPKGKEKRDGNKRTTRLCAKVAPEPEVTNKQEYKLAFKAGIPKSNSAGTVTSFDSGCSTMTSSSCSTKIFNVPKPRHPYAKKNYNIETLVPPFACLKGGAGQGGYPEHWRLASVYQHAYKPIEQRRRPLLETVYK